MVCGVRGFFNPGRTFWFILDIVGLKIDKTSHWSVSRMFLMSGLLSFFTVSSVFLPSSRAAVDQCQSSVCWGEMCVLRRSANKAQPARRWSCCGVTFDLREALSLRLGCLWRGRGAPRSPQGSSRGQSKEPRASVLPFPTSTPTNRPAAGGRRRRRRMWKGASEEGWVFNFCFSVFPSAETNNFFFTETYRRSARGKQTRGRYFTGNTKSKNTPLQVKVQYSKVGWCCVTHSLYNFYH